MPKLDKAARRDAKRHNARNGHRKVRYNTLRQGESLVNFMAHKTVIEPSKGQK
jgi:hypothetical protein